LAGSLRGDYRPEGCPDKVNEHDFADKELGKAIPYGVYDMVPTSGNPTF
jgi:hypothetical protein